MAGGEASTLGALTGAAAGRAAVTGAAAATLASLGVVATGVVRNIIAAIEIEMLPTESLQLKMVKI